MDDDPNGSAPHKNLLIFARASSSSVDQPSTSSSGSSGQNNNTQLLHLSATAACHNSCSDDSGCLVHTNNSISSGDSSRIFLNCKHDFELIESDGEVSQFDSLDNSNSEGGMSAENFNTLKKGPLAPIDPPPEFQDSPQTTLLRTKGYQLHDFAQLLIKDILGEAFLSLLQHNPRHRRFEVDGNDSCSGTVRRNFISASDPQLNVTTIQPAMTTTTTTTISPAVENIYDDPSDSTRNSDDIEVDYYISKQVFDSTLARKKSSTLSANSQLLLRPNSRNSLQSRLSSSHNSLATTGTSKVDDTTFITQAMSHDPLMGRQSIIDFYNVPLDSDIYALPVDVVQSPDAITVVDVDERRSRRFRFSSSGGGGRFPLMVMSKSSEAKRRLFRKAQSAASSKLASKAASVSHSQLVTVTVNGAPAAATSSSTSSVLANGRSGDAKRFSAPDGLSEALNYSARMKQQRKKLKREKRGSSSSSGHQQQKLLQGHKTATSDSSDADVEALNGEAAEKERGNNNSNIKEKKRGKEGKSSRPLTITISKTLNPSKSSNKKATIPISTSFTSQSSMQSNCATTSAGGGGAAGSIGGSGGGKEDNGKTTKRETRDATKRGHNQFSTNLKQKFCSIFRFRNNKQSQLVEYEYNNNYEITDQKSSIADRNGLSAGGISSNGEVSKRNSQSSTTTIMLRALPPLPKRAPPEVPASGSEANRRRPPAELPPQEEIDSNNNNILASSDGADILSSDSGEPMAGRLDFASNLETIKQYGWYWGPISCQAAEKILSNEPDGSFIVRDSSDDHYIFSLTFKLNNCVRHVRIEQDKGTFSFGSLAKFKARTIVDFIEQALEYSRSGRYLFFLHRRPEHGPMRVQLKNPVSRFKHIQSLQHMCRFVIMKAIVRKDLIQSLPLPNRLKDYLSYKNCYTEHFDDGMPEENVPEVRVNDEVLEAEQTQDDEQQQQ